MRETMQQHQEGVMPDEDRSSSLGHMPMGSWRFDESVAAVFDDMLSRSIPHLQVMRENVIRAATHFAQPDTLIVDLGCSLGGAMAPLIERLGSSNRFLGIESSEPMVSACRERFNGLIEKGIVEIRMGDLRHSYPEVCSSVSLCILTLMFIPIEYRLRLMSQAFEKLLDGGALIVVEKVLAANALLDGVFLDLYYRYKSEMGYTAAEIDCKRTSLEGVLVPLTAAWNEQLLHAAGFQHVECFWRSLNFCGWIAIKGQAKSYSF